MVHSHPNKMDANQPSTNNINSENINIIKKIINDFENQSNSVGSMRSSTHNYSNNAMEYHASRTPKASRRSRKVSSSKFGKISHSDSFIHKYKKSQISPKTNSLENNFIKYKPATSLQEFIENEDNVYINFMERGDNENADANSFNRSQRSKLNLLRNSIKYSDGLIDDIKLYAESKKHQEKVKRNVKEVSCTN